jgi:hypothetical protein
MGGIIDFETSSCPWEVYLFALVHILGAVFMYVFDSCRVIGTAPCNDAEKVMEAFAAYSMLYVGVIFGVLNYHGKTSAAKVTRLSNVALHCAVALLVSVVFAGNSSLTGGIERSWCHMGDILTGIILVGVLIARVSKTDAEWAQGNPLGEGMGINCKTLLLLFLVLTAIKFLALTDFVDPTKMLADGSEMTDFAVFLWHFVTVIVFEVFLAIFYAVLFDDEVGHELVVCAIVVMSVIGAVSIHPVQKYMSGWMGMDGNTLWIRMGIVILVCIAAIVGGRRGGHRSGYQNV